MFQELFPIPMFKNNPWGFIEVRVHPVFTKCFTCLLLLTLAGLSSSTRTLPMQFLWLSWEFPRCKPTLPIFWTWCQVVQIWIIFRCIFGIFQEYSGLEKSAVQSSRTGIFFCKARNFSFSLSHWSLAQARPTQPTQNLIAHCPKAQLE